MNISTIKNGDKTTLALSGRLNTLTAPQLHEVIVAEFDSAKHVELDFAELAFISSAGLRVLILGRETAKAKDGQFTIIHVSEAIMEVFEMAGVTNVLSIG